MLFSCQSEEQKWKFEQNLKIWKSKMAAACDVIYLTIVARLRHHVVSFNWKYKWSLLYAPNFKTIGWIVLKVEGKRGPIDPPPPLEASYNYFF